MLNITQKQKLVYSLRTMPITSPYYFILERDGVKYGINHESFLRTFAPSDSDYMKTYLHEADALRQSGKKKRRFVIVAALETVECENNYVKAKFLLPGRLNQVLTIKLDPHGQDFKGEIGLQINASIEIVT